MIKKYQEDYVKEDFEKAEWNYFEDERQVNDRNILMKAKCIAFNCSKKFNIENINNYEIITFINNDFQLKIFPPQSLINNSEKIYYFELIKLNLDLK